MLKRSASVKILPQMPKKKKDSQSVEKVKRSLSEKIEQQKDKMMKDNQSGKNVKNNRFLIKVVVVGSAGPLRFIVKEDDHVSGVIETTLKSYAREGRLPLLGSDVNNFLLCPINAGFEALNPRESIGSHWARNFVLCKKSQAELTKGTSEMMAQKASVTSKDWVNMSLTFWILAH